MEDIAIADTPRIPPKLDRYADFLNKGQNVTTTTTTSTVTTVENPRGAVSMDEGVLPEAIKRNFPCYASGCGESFKSRKDCDFHYNGKHQNVCSICKKNFNSSYLLELHVTETHDAFFAVMSKTRPMYECFLDTCTEKFNTEDERFSHCIEQHKDKRPFYFPRSKSLNTPTNKGQPNDPSDAVMEFDGEESDIASVKSQPESTNPSTPKKKGSKNNVPGKLTHISFGQKAVKFIPRQTFGLAKKNKGQNMSNEEKMDLSEMQDVLSEFSPNPSTSASTSASADTVVPKSQENLVSEAMPPLPDFPGSESQQPLTSSNKVSAAQNLEEQQLQQHHINEIHEVDVHEKRKWLEEGRAGDIKKLKLCE